MQFAFNFPIFDHLSDERVLADLAVEAEQSGWDAVLLWDHVNLHQQAMANGGPHAEPWIALAFMADRTEKILLGTCVTPIARRRPVKLAREILALHRLSCGRFVFGAGLGAGPAEFDDLGEEADPRVRAEMLDEGLELLKKLWSGDPVEHAGRHYQVSSPTPMGSADIPIWLAGTWPNRKPFRRAARFDGAFAMKVGFLDPLGPKQVAEIAAYIASERQSGDPFNLAVGANTSGNLEKDRERATALEKAGANWWMDGTLTQFEKLDALTARVRAGPPR